MSNSTTLRWVRRLGVAAGAVVLLLGAGLIVFLASIPAPARSLPPRGDAIIVLTGSEERIRAAALILKQQRGRRLLISGVNRINGREDVRRVTGLPAELFDCCVDLGYSALDTMGNAAEAREWASVHNVDSLIVVTTTVHMPRSLADLGRTMPKVRLIPHGVAVHLPGSQRPASSVFDWTVARYVLKEYVKFLPAAALNVASRLLHPVNIGLAGSAGARESG